MEKNKIQEINKLILKHVRKERRKVFNEIVRRMQNSIDQTKLRGDRIRNRGNHVLNPTGEAIRDDLYKSIEGLEKAKNIIFNIKEKYEKEIYR